MEISTYQAWRTLSDDYVVLRYMRKGISTPAEYTFLRRPETISASQMDTITALEQGLLKEVHHIVVKQGMFERFALRGAECRWTQQLSTYDFSRFLANPNCRGSWGFLYKL